MESPATLQTLHQSSTQRRAPWRRARSVWLGSLLLLLALFLRPPTAHAGRRAYVIDYDLPSVPDGDVEIESWLDLVWNRNTANQWRWWLGPRWAPTESVELVALTAFAQSSGQQAELWAELVDIRWHFYSHPRAGTLTLQVNARIAIDADLAHQLSPQLGWATRAGRWNFAAQVGYAGGFGGPQGFERYHLIVYSTGVAVDVVKGQLAPPLQLGVELFGEGVIAGYNDLNKQAGSTVNLGPTFAVAKGRLWLSAGMLFGLTQDSPFAFLRGVIGVAL